MGYDRRTLKAPKSEKIFLWLALIFGPLFLILLPPFQAPDEPFHFLRAYQIASGQWGEGAGVKVPASVVEFLSAFDHIPLKPAVKTSAQEILSFRDQLLDPDRTVFIPYATALPHPPLPYGPQALGIALGKTLDLSPFHLFYFGRVLNLLGWIVLVFAALRLCPIYPWLLLLLALTPMSIHQAASLSPDAMTNGVAFLFFAALMRLLMGGAGPLAPSSLALSAASSLALTLSKLAYAANSLFLFLVPVRAFAPRSRRWLCLPLLVLANLGIGWALLRFGRRGSEGLSSLRMASISADPAAFLGLLANTFAFYGPAYAEQFLGRLGHLDTALPWPLLAYLGALLFFFAVFDRGPGPRLSWKQKCFVLALLLAEVLAIWIGLHLNWREEGGGVIRGGQGRYLIPLAPFFFLLFYRPRAEGSKPAPPWLGALAFYSVSMVLVVSAVFLWRRFYGAT